MPPLPNQSINHMQGAKGHAPPNRGRPNPSATPTVSYTPTDTIIPSSLYDKVPNLNLYKRLKDAERKIDLLVSKKALDFQAIQQKAIQPSNFKRETGILRVFVYNTCENQPWQKQLLKEQGHSLPDLASSEGSWTLRVEGRFLNTNKKDIDKPSLKFNSLLSGISVDIIPNDDYPELNGASNNLIEWRDQATGPAQNGRQSDFDGLDIKREGIFDIDVKIALMVKAQGNILRISDVLAQFVGKQEATLQEIIFSIWQYSLYKSLLKKQSSFTNIPAVSSASALNDINQGAHDDELSTVECDEILHKLLGVSSFKFSDLYKLLQPHFKPREPIIIPYKVNTRKSSTLGEVVIDIPVELPPSVSEIQKDLLEFNKSTFEELTRSDNTIQKINNRISLGIVALQNANRREKFYKELSEDPAKFIERWVENQLTTLKALKSDDSYDEELVRRSEYFIENEDVLKEKIDILLGSTRF
ncbi:uncharacterized protein PRCAT00001616001 [Priceomyces carsonii]|uniref:uncharacterized protein n=1 Tax=Priceomyces carsonii TaxID=28549 RepID=UPI002ED955A7|nr:unnamed protein product [Priceomyces carsonii]